MKFSLSIPVGQVLGRLFGLALMLGAAAFPFSVAAQPSPAYTNLGVNTPPWPQIDATNFINSGTLTFSSPILIDRPWASSDTQNFTNSGSMVSTPGWQFDNEPVNIGSVVPAASFVNRSTGVIQANDGPVLIVLGVPNTAVVAPSFLHVNATNIANQGQMIVGADGELALNGGSINVSRSLLEVTPISASATGSINGSPTPTNFFPDIGIYDDYWERTNMDVNTKTLWNGSIASSPIYNVSNFLGTATIDQITIIPAYADSYSNTLKYANVTITNADQSTSQLQVISNIVKQAVFVGAPNNPNLSVQTGFVPSTQPTNNFQTVGVLLSLTSTNLVTAQPEITQIFFQDQLASEPGSKLLLNVVSDSTYRPTNYLMSRLNQGLGVAGNNGWPDPAFFFVSNDFAGILNNTNDVDPNGTAEIMTNATVTGVPYSAYEATVDNLVSRAPSIPAGTVTNYPGRIRINADTLDLSRTRVRGEGEVVIQTKHLVGSVGAVVDCENLSYNLASTNGSLTVTNLAGNNVTRLTGLVRAWSSTWTNKMSLILVSYDTNSSPVFVTNTVSIDYHVLILDASAVKTTLPVTVFDLVTHSTNTVLGDSMTVVQSLLIDGQSLTLDGSLNLSSIVLSNAVGTAITVSVLDWRYTNAPSLLYFTNNGTLTIPNEAHFGDDFPNNPSGYLDFVNHGTITAAGGNINSYYCELGGVTSIGASLNVGAHDGNVDGGQISAGNDLLFRANTLKFNQATVVTGTRLYLTPTNSLYDNGPASSNSFACGEGFYLTTMPTNPANGDLLGTALNTTAGPYGPEVDHVWAAQDRGVANAGFSNNVALGSLTLTPGAYEIPVEPLFVFGGAGVSNAIYVDLLDLSQLSDYTNEMEISPNMVIYYAAAKTHSPPPVNAYGIPQEPEEFLDGQFGGHLRWVRSFAGPNSSVDVVINGQTVKVNKALRFSRIIDSNGNGIPNYYDPNPFNGLVLSGSLVQSNPPPAKVFGVTWNATPGTLYYVQVSTNLPSWQLLTTYTSSYPTNKNVTVLDTNAAGGGAPRYYRVSY